MNFLRKQIAKSVEHTLADAKVEIDAMDTLFKQRIGEAVLDGSLPVMPPTAPKLAEITQHSPCPSCGRDDCHDSSICGGG